VAVSRVEFYVNGVLQATDTATPYVNSWNTSTLPAGTYTLMMKAYDAANNVGQSANVSVTVVADTTAPIASITAPANNATVSGTVAVTCNATDNVGVSKIELYDNGVLKAAGNVSPFTYSWNTAAETNGSAILTVKAYDAAGNVGQSSAVTVTINNVPDNSAPSVTITAPANNATVSGTATISAAASDNVGVTQVEFYVNGALKSTASAAPFSYSWNTTTVANGSYTLSAKAYDAAGNVGQSSNVSVTVNNVASVTPIAFVQVASATPANGTQVAVSYPNTQVAGDLNIVVIGWNDTVSSVLSVKDSAGNVYALAAGPTSGSGFRQVIYYAKGVVAGSNTVTVTFSQKVPYPDIRILEYAGVNTLDKNAGASGTSATSSSGSVTTSAANELVVSANTIWPYSTGAGTGCTPRVITSDGNIAQDMIVNSVGTYTHSAPLNSSGAWVMQVVAFNYSDTSAPNVALGAPINNDTISGTTVVSANASDNVAVVKAEFYLNGALQATVTSAPYSYNWNTLLVANGAYILSAKAYDTAGNVGQSASVAVTVFNDTTAPVVSIANPVNNSTMGGSVSVSANASDNVGVTKVEFYLNGVLQTTVASAPYSFTWNTLVAANGAYTLSAKAYDAAGNVGQSANVSVTVFNDTIAPVVSIAAPVNNSTAGGSVSVSANASDNVGVTKVEFYLNGVLQATVASAPYSFNWNTLAAANGAYTLSAKAYDAAGNVGQSANVSVTVFNDTIAPVVAIAAPVNNSTAGGSVSVSANASDNVGVTKVEFYLNGALQSTITSAPFSFTWNTLAAANGAYTICAKAYDAAGNVGQSANVSVIVFNDTIAPVVSIAAPVNNSTAGGTVSVSANASDNVGVTKVEFYLNGALQSTVASAPYSFNWNTLAAANGAYILSAKAYDAAGNVGQSAGVSVTVFNDTVAPTISAFTMPASAQALTVPVTSFVSTDNVGVTGYFISENSSAPAAGAASWSVAAPVSFTFAGFGSRTAHAWAKDAAGNVSACSSASVTITQPDTTAPSITALSPLSGTKVGSRVTITASATDNVAVTKMMLYIDSVLKATNVDGSLSWVWNTSSYSRGLHVIMVSAYDAANNMSSKSVTVSK